MTKQKKIEDLEKQVEYWQSRFERKCQELLSVKETVTESFNSWNDNDDVLKNIICAGKEFSTVKASNAHLRNENEKLWWILRNIHNDVTIPSPKDGFHSTVTPFGQC